MTMRNIETTDLSILQRREDETVTQWNNRLEVTKLGKAYAQFQRGYIGAIEWLTVDSPDWCLDALGDMDADAPAWSKEAALQIERDCVEFFTANYDDLNRVANMYSDNYPNDYSWFSAGHDYWLTRNGYGVGYLDRDLGDIGERLAEACEYTGQDVCRGHDGLLYIV